MLYRSFKAIKAPEEKYPPQFLSKMGLSWLFLQEWTIHLQKTYLSPKTFLPERVIFEFCPSIRSFEW